jgi:hypothetical protein
MVIGMPVSSNLPGEKNSHLFSLWSPLPKPLRQEDIAGTGYVGCRMANLSSV